jgi:hypothetical protein
MNGVPVVGVRFEESANPDDRFDAWKDGRAVV